jgi:hypothetical protein
MLDHALHVVGLAAPFVMHAFARAHAAEIEAERRRARLDEGARERRDHLVVHRAAEERMRMRDHRNRARRIGHRGGALDLARGALDQLAGGGGGHARS